MKNDLMIPRITASNPTDVVVKEYEKALYYENGKFVKVFGPGRHDVKRESGLSSFVKGLVGFVSLGLVRIPHLQTEVTHVDTRLKTLGLTGQEILTLDKVPVRLNLVAQYKISDPAKAINESENCLENVYQDLQMSARNYTSSVTLDSLLANKGKLGEKILKDISPAAAALGIDLVSAGLKDIVLPGDIRELMAKEIAAKKEASSKLILAREEVATSRALANAAKIIASDQNILVLKKLDLMREISKNPANKVYFGGELDSTENLKATKRKKK